MIVAAVGKNASGKDYFLEYISKKYGVPMYSIGDIARDLAEEAGLEKTRDNLHMISNKYMSQYGNDFFPQRLIQKIKDANLADVLVSGIRPPSDVEHFKAAFGDQFFLVSIIVESDRVRYERSVARGTERDHITFEKFLELDQSEEKLFHTNQTIEMADYKVFRGEVPDEEYHRGIDQFYETYMKK